MSAATPDIRPDLDALITLLDDLLAKVEAGAVLPEHVRIHLKEERALLLRFSTVSAGRLDLIEQIDATGDGRAARDAGRGRS